VDRCCREAAGYDARMAVIERLLFGDGRRWVCERALGDVLEIAVGTGRNLDFYSPGTRLTASS
jgi:hypothetical protein